MSRGMFIYVHETCVLSFSGRFYSFEILVNCLSCSYRLHSFLVPSLTLMCVYNGVYYLLLNKEVSAIKWRNNVRASALNVVHFSLVSWCGAYTPQTEIRKITRRSKLSCSWLTLLALTFFLGSVLLPFVRGG